MSASGRGWAKAAGVGYCFLVKMPVSASVRMPSLTRRFSLARVPSAGDGLPSDREVLEMGFGLP